MTDFQRSAFAPEDDTPRPSTWSQDRRLKFIDFRLRWEGRINRTDLTRFFDISMPQASADLSKYAEAAPGNLLYSGRAKAYLRTESFIPFYSRSASNTYLNELLTLEAGVMEPKSSFIGWQPDLGVVPLPKRMVDGGVLSRLLQAIKDSRRVLVRYQSMTDPEPTTCTLSPHALAYDGFRWHVRAYCHRRERFRDFVIARLSELTLEQPSDISVADDVSWNTVLTLVLAAHPKLSPQAKKAIQMDFGMDGGSVKFVCRQALIFYALRRLGLDHPEKDEPAANQIILLNRHDLQPYIDQFDQKEAG
jgi:WYL domain